MRAKVLTVHCWTFVVSFSPPSSLPPCWKLARSEWPSTTSAPRGLKGGERERENRVGGGANKGEKNIESKEWKMSGKQWCAQTTVTRKMTLPSLRLSFPSGWLKLQDDPSLWINEVNTVKKKYKRSNLWFHTGHKANRSWLVRAVVGKKKKLTDNEIQLNLLSHWCSDHARAVSTSNSLILSFRLNFFSSFYIIKTDRCVYSKGSVHVKSYRAVDVACYVHSLFLQHFIVFSAPWSIHYFQQMSYLGSHV